MTQLTQSKDVTQTLKRTLTVWQRAVIIFAGVFALTTGMPALAQNTSDYPNRLIRVIVPFGPGSGVDTNGRFFAQQLADELGQAVVVENRPGADGAIGVNAVKTTAPDGYTVLLASNSSLTVNPIVIKGLPYDPMKDLKPVSGLTRGMTVFVVAADSKLNTAQDLVSAMKAAKEPVMVGTYSTGYRLAIEWFAEQAGVKFTNVPYKGAALMLTDAVGGRLDWAVTDLVGAAELLRSGKLKAIAVSGETRHSDFPNVPTLKESGFANYVNYTWASLSVHADTPDAITRKLSDALQRVFKKPTTLDFLRQAKLELMPYPPDEMLKFQTAETARWRRVADAAGIKPE